MWCVFPRTLPGVPFINPQWLCVTGFAYCGIQHFLAQRRKEVPPSLILGMDLLLVALLCLASGGLQSHAYVYFYGIILTASIRFGVFQGLSMASVNTLLTIGIESVVSTTANWSQPVIFLSLQGFLLAGVSGLFSHDSKYRLEESTAERERRKADRLLALQRTLISCSFNTLPQRLVDELIRLIPCRSVGVVLSDRQHARTLYGAGAGMFSVQVNEINASLTHGVLATALERGTLLLTSSDAIRTRLQSFPQLHECAQHNLLIVRLSSSLFQGCLIFGDKKGEEFSSEDIQFITTITEDAARIIDRAGELENIRAAKHSQHHLLHAIISAQEQERKYEVEEWNERLGNKLFQVIKDFRSCQEMIGHRIPEMKERAERLAAELDNIAALMRNFTNELHPLVLYDFGFVEALREYVAGLQEQETFTVTLQTDPPPPQLPNEAILSLYRITQEAVRNIRQHAHAKNVEIAFVSREQSGVSLMIKDDGQGFDPEDAHDGQYGLLYMRERAEACGGELHVNSARGQGTEIRVDFQPKGSSGTTKPG